MSKAPYLGPKGTEALMRIMKDEMSNCGGGDGSLSQDLEFTVDPITGELMLSSKYEIANLEVRDGYLIMTNVNGDRTTFRPMGAYNPETEYKRGDLIHYENSGYVVMVDKLIGVTPTENDTTNYMLLVRGGRDGVDGKDGIDGKDGENGIDGKDGKDGSDAEVVNPNLLINCDFRRPVNRNGKTEYTSGYTVDLWKMRSNDIGKLSIVDGGVILETMSSIEGFPSVNQTIQNYESLYGETVTLSVLVSEFSSNVTSDMFLAYSTAVTGQTEFDNRARISSPGLYSVTTRVRTKEGFDQYTHLNFCIRFDGAKADVGSKIKIVAAKLELGSKQTLAHQDADGNWILNSPVDYESEYAKCSLYSMHTGEWIGLPVVSNHNFLINADFREPVNSNGRSVYSVSSRGTTIDRWGVYNGARTTKLEVKDSYITMSPNSDESGENTYIGIGQTFRDYKHCIGKVMTTSMLYRATNIPDGARCSFGFRMDGSKITAVKNSDTWELITVTTTIPDGLEWIVVALTLSDILDTNTSIDIKAVKLELGYQQTLAHRDNNGEWVLNDEPNYELQYSLCSQFSSNTGEWYGNVVSNHNLLDNWYFVDPANQREQTEYTGITGQYTIDRWKINYSSSIKLLDDGIEISTSERYGGIWQIAEILPDLKPGDSCTFSALFSEVQNGWYVNTHLVVDGQKVLSVLSFAETPGLVSVTMTIPDSLVITKGSYLRFFICTDIAGETSCKVVAAKVELGPIQTLAHQNKNGEWVLNDAPPNKATELLKCQRYFYNPILFGGDSCTIGESYSDGIYEYAQFTVDLPNMRIVPSLIWSGTFELLIRGTIYPVTSITLSPVLNSTTKALITANSNVTLPTGTCILRKTKSSLKFFFDANL